MEPVKRVFTLISEDDEIQAIQIFLEVLADLDDSQRGRVLNYAGAWISDTKNMNNGFVGMAGALRGRAEEEP